MQEQNIDQPIPWDSPVADIPREEKLVFDEGTYEFEVKKIERKRRADDAKYYRGIAYAELTIELSGGNGTYTTMKTDLLLCTSQAWKIREFGKCIGDTVVDGQPYAIQWNQLPGRSGIVSVIKDSFKGKDGKEVYLNRVSAWEKPGTKTTQPAGQAQPAPQQFQHVQPMAQPQYQPQFQQPAQAVCPF